MSSGGRGAPSSSLVLLWHMHQPDYRDPQTGLAELPWVRLHAASAYRDMASVLAEAPEVHVTVDFVPSLLEQLAAVAGGATDAYEVVARQPAADLEPAERELLLGRFFSVHWGRQVETRPRYRELLLHRGAAPSPPAAAASFSARDLCDLAVLFHLAWVGFAVRAEEPLVDELERKGAGFSEDEKLALLDLIRRQASRVVPAWQKLRARGQVEIASAPYYHPIVPLLCDTDVARTSLPEARLPERFAFPEDAREQILRAQALHERTFGAPPAGMWPPEGSLSAEAVGLYAERGVRWLGSDEGVLYASLGGVDRVARTRPHRFAGVHLLFRDHELSDRVGFAYANTPPERAVEDLLGRARAAGEGGLACVFLDGENAWETYEGRGAPFLRALYRAVSRAEGLRTRTISEALAESRSTELPRLWPGSWIDARFAIWIGDPDKNRAWEALGRARRATGAVAAAREHLYVAEGSDWFWWFGEPFHSAEDPLYDRLFRARLAAAYRAAGLSPPPELSLPLGHGEPKPAQPPRRFISPRLDGLVTSFYEWSGAGRFDIPRGAAMGEGRPRLARIFWGFDRERLYVRLDPAEPAEPPDDPLAPLRGTEIRLELRAGERQLRVRTTVDEVALPVVEETAPAPRPLGRGDGFARLEILEIGVSFATLGLRARESVELVVQLLAGGISVGRYPRDGYLGIEVPDENFEAENWSA